MANLIANKLNVLTQHVDVIGFFRRDNEKDKCIIHESDINYPLRKKIKITFVDKLFFMIVFRNYIRMRMKDICLYDFRNKTVSNSTNRSYWSM